MTGAVATATMVAVIVALAVFLILIALNVVLFLALRSGIPQGPFANRDAEQTRPVPDVRRERK